MKVLVLGVLTMEGTAQKGRGARYDFAQVLIATPMDSAVTEHMRRNAQGFEMTAMDATREVVEQMMGAGIRYPSVVELTTDMQPKRGKFEPVVVGFKAEAVRAAG